MIRAMRYWLADMLDGAAYRVRPSETVIIPEIVTAALLSNSVALAHNITRHNALLRRLSVERAS